MKDRGGRGDATEEPRGGEVVREAPVEIHRSEERLRREAPVQIHRADERLRKPPLPLHSVGLICQVNYFKK